MPAIDPADLESLLRSPREVLDLELKEWIDPATDEGKAKIAKACIALRNNDGGALVIGITNDGDVAPNGPADLRSRFHIDVIQRIVGTYASEQFAITVEIVNKDGTDVVAVLVPSGVRTPVACKADLPGDGRLLKCHAVYVRTLHSNNTVSSSPARHGDWPRLIQICFDNREADIGGFVRRHLSGVNLPGLISAIQGVQQPTEEKSATERAEDLLDDGYARFLTRLKERHSDEEITLGTREIAIVLESTHPGETISEELLWRLGASMPRHTGWPPWVGLSGGAEEHLQPYVLSNGWEAFLFTRVFGASVDFWRLVPSGAFYHVRVLEEDLKAGAEPRTALDFLLQITRTAEAISVVQSFARTLGFPDDSTQLGIASRWRRLRGRHLASLAEPSRSFRSRGAAVQDEIKTTTHMPLDTPASAMTPFVEQLVQPLFALFGGMQFQTKVVDSIVQKHLTQRY